MPWHKIKEGRTNSVSGKNSQTFLDAFISMDNACKNALQSNKSLENMSFGGNGGVTVYINKLVELRFAPERSEVLPKLVRYRNMRNRLVHEKNASKVIDVSKKDINWINKFEKRLKKGRDPISTYLRNERIYKTWSRIRFIVILLLLVVLGIAVFTLLKKIQII